jgi:hypothetical protein
VSRLIRTDVPVPPPRRGYLVSGPVAPVFVERGALAPEHAVEFTPLAHQRRAFAAMRDAGMIRQAGGRWWLDMVAYEQRRAARTRAWVPVAIVLSVAAAGVATLFYSSAGGF